MQRSKELLIDFIELTKQELLVDPNDEQLGLFQNRAQQQRYLELKDPSREDNFMPETVEQIKSILEEKYGYIYLFRLEGVVSALEQFSDLSQLSTETIEGMLNSASHVSMHQEAHGFPGYEINAGMLAGLNWLVTNNYFTE